MNYPPIHTTVYPSYNYISAENSFLKQTIEYRDHVLHEQQGTINKLNADVDQLSQANAQFRTECSKAKADAARWQVMKKIILTQGGERQLYEVQKTIDKELERNRAKGKQ